CLFLIIIQGLLVAGGGERNGMEGIVVGIVWKEGMVGSGGKLKFGIDVGMVGKLGNEGSVGLGSDGKGGSVGLGKVGTTGKVGVEDINFPYNEIYILAIKDSRLYFHTMKSSNKRKLLTQDQATQTSTETNRVLDIYVTSIEIQTAKWSICLFLIIIQGLLVAGGGERSGMEGIVVGIVGKEGMVRSGGKLKFGIDVGMVGKLGNGGSVGLGSDG
ncbi:uncharacterized protein LOC133881277, partial [Alnus glutinosa]|uniref:uncharacterized protein LOC133881277 n=1 Tax=Alnus glutinosa TaxID=3517 RepID=UPI002D7A3EE7